MKKISMLLSLIVALAMFIMPMGAMAEVTTAQVVQFANPVIYVDGQQMAKLDGLAAQFAYCEGSEVAQFIFDIFVGGENANSAMIQVDPNYDVVGYVGGMSNAYTFNAMEVINMFTEAMAAESGLDMDQISNIIALAENWTLPTDLTNVLNNHTADFTVTELGYQTGSNGIEMYCTQITGDAMPMLIDMARVIDNDQLICAVLQLLDPSMTTLGLTDNLTYANLGMNIDATIGYDMSGEIMELNATITMTEEGETVSVIGYVLYMDMTDENNIVYNYNATIAEADGEIVGTIDMDMVLTATGMTAKMVEVIDGETMTMDMIVDINGINDVVSIKGNVSDLSTVSIVYNGGVTQTGYGFKLDIDSNDYGTEAYIDIAGDYGITDTSAVLNLSMIASDASGEENGLKLNLAGDAEAGVYSATLETVDTYSGSVSIGLKFTETAPAEGAYYSGILSLMINDGYNEISADTEVHLLEVDVDTDSFYISPAAAIALLTMDDAQLELAATEMDAALSAVGTAIMNTYPEFFGN